MRRPGHRVCTCYQGVVGAPITCHVMQSDAFAALDLEKGKNKALKLVVMRCRAGCDHWHVYSKDFIDQLNHMDEGNGQGTRQTA